MAIVYSNVSNQNRYFRKTVIPIAFLTVSWILFTATQQVSLAHTSAMHERLLTESGASAPSSSKLRSKLTPKRTPPQLKPGSNFPASAEEKKPTKATQKPFQIAQAAAIAEGEYQIIAKHSNKCVDVEGFSQDDGANVHQWNCSGTNNQIWTLKPFGDAYQIVSKNSDKCLDVAEFSTEDGGNIHQWGCSGSDNQLWELQSSGDGYHQIISKHSNKCLDIADVSTNDGANVHQWGCFGGDNQTFSLKPVGSNGNDANVKGKWGNVIGFTSIPVAAAVLPNGKVITWSSQDPQDYASSTGKREQTYTAIFNPATDEVQESLEDSIEHDMFCPGTAMLPDGRLLVNGGGPDSPRTSIFDFRTNQWSKDKAMNFGRWYNTSVTLPNGNVFTLGGNRGSVAPGELWDASSVSEKWLEKTGTSSISLLGYNRSDEYPRLFVAPNGKIFASGPTPMMHWFDLSNSEGGSHQDAGFRGDDDYAQNSVNVMYDQGKILKTGGANLFTGGVPSNDTYVIDINDGVNTRKVTSMTYKRAFANGVVMPDGKVMVVGGVQGNENDGFKAHEFKDEGSIYIPELWDPATEQWTNLAMHSKPRNYHSVALLLPDGRVFAGGGGLCGGCSTNHPNAEIFTPPYLFDANGGLAARPVINSAASEIGYNWTFTVYMDDDMPIEKFNLIRLSSATHSTNTDQRFLSLPFTSEGGNSYSLQAPENANIAPPGYYMLFALNNQGVPSVAKIIQIK